MAMKNEHTMLDGRPVKILGRGLRKDRRLEMPLASLRTAANLSQNQVAAATNIDQADISRLENRDSLDECQVSTLRRYVEALGGKLELVAVFPKGHRIAIGPARK
jgi:transcriptional regulator with XRE-family HTH domain